MKIGFAVAGLAAVSGAVALIAKAVSMVVNGRGLETYRTFWLVEVSYVGLLVFIMAALVACLVAVALRIRDRAQWEELDRKYGKPK